MKELRIHGRGGQGAVTSAEMLALAAIEEGKFALAFPAFGPERRGAPVQAFVRTDDQQVKIRAEVRQPDAVIVLDPGLLAIVDVTSGLKDDGVLIVNTKKPPEAISALYNDKWPVATLDATAIAVATIGVNIVNTTMLGAIVRVTNVVELDSLINPLNNRFGNKADQNFEACRKAYEATICYARSALG